MRLRIFLVVLLFLLIGTIDAAVDPVLDFAASAMKELNRHSDSSIGVISKAYWRLGEYKQSFVFLEKLDSASEMYKLLGEFITECPPDRVQIKKIKYYIQRISAPDIQVDLLTELTIRLAKSNFARADVASLIHTIVELNQRNKTRYQGIYYSTMTMKLVNEIAQSGFDSSSKPLVDLADIRIFSSNAFHQDEVQLVEELVNYYARKNNKDRIKRISKILHKSPTEYLPNNLLLLTFPGFSNRFSDENSKALNAILSHFENIEPKKARFQELVKYLFVNDSANSDFILESLNRQGLFKRLKKLLLDTIDPIYNESYFGDLADYELTYQEIIRILINAGHSIDSQNLAKKLDSLNSTKRFSDYFLYYSILNELRSKGTLNYRLLDQVEDYAFLKFDLLVKALDSTINKKLEIDQIMKRAKKILHSGKLKNRGYSRIFTSDASDMVNVLLKMNFFSEAMMLLPYEIEKESGDISKLRLFQYLLESKNLKKAKIFLEEYPISSEYDPLVSSEIAKTLLKSGHSDKGIKLFKEAIIQELSEEGGFFSDIIQNYVEAQLFL